MFPTTQKCVWSDWPKMWYKCSFRHKLILFTHRIWREDRKHDGSFYTVSFCFALCVCLLFFLVFFTLSVCYCDDDSAVSVGTEMLEMDCHLTSDGYVVISHDSNLLRQTGYDKTVSSLRFQVVILPRKLSPRCDLWWSLSPVLCVSGFASL